MLRSLLHYIVLPEQITQFEATYLKRMNRVGLVFFLLHLPVFVGVAYFNNSNPLLALGLTLLVLAGPAAAYVSFENPRNISLVYGFTAMLMGGLLVHFGQGSMQIEMHFYFFALLAMLAVFGNPLAIVVAAGTVAAHHLLGWLLLPSSVFNYSAPVWTVLVHAMFVVLESVATCFIARSFFDNVIGLEKIVQARTEELAARGRDMRLVLDNVNQGFLTIDRNGVMSPERSRIVEQWLGAANDNGLFVDYVGKRRPSFASSFSFAWNEVIEGVMPLELTIDQLPKQFTVDGHHYSVQCKPIERDGTFDKALIVISDVTADIERERLEAQQRDVLNVLGRIASDKDGVLEFFEEANALIHTIDGGREESLSEIKRAVHTLKGNALLFGVTIIGALCHELESRIEVEQQLPSRMELTDLVTRWKAFCATLDTLLGEGTQRKLEIEDQEYEAVLRSLLHDTPRAQVAERIANWRLEPTEKRLKRIAEQAQGIARRLNKAPLRIEIAHHQLRVDPRHWATFWSAFVHVVRNAIDHGVESPEDRVAAGKAPEGRLVLATAMREEHFTIEITDDGRGIDWTAVADKAKKLGLRDQTKADLEDALFADGFSTKHDVSELSGRGVGLGAVKAACESLHGTLKIESDGAQGTRIEFSFPVSAMRERPALRAVG
jgi:two-component system chemotaxis sensor kinase CheA